VVAQLTLFNFVTFFLKKVRNEESNVVSDVLSGLVDAIYTPRINLQNGNKRLN
jgi:hypothetical protein